MSKPDRKLEELNLEWQKSRQKFTLKKALTRCQKGRLVEPAWLRAAVYGLGRELVMKAEKEGRPTGWVIDAVVYDTVEEHIKAFRLLRREGLLLRGDRSPQERALKLTALEFGLKVKRGERKGEPATYTVKNAWLRHKKRIVKLGAPEEDTDDGLGPCTWNFKPQLIRENEDLRRITRGGLPDDVEIPSYFRTKNKPSRS